MNKEQKLVFIKLVHTAIWVFFNVVIFYMLYAVLINRIDKWIWIGLSLVLLEGLILVVCKNICPITLVARKYSSSTRDNFDIYLPEWLARYNKQIYSSIVVVIVIILLWRVLWIIPGIADSLALYTVNAYSIFLLLFYFIIGMDKLVLNCCVVAVLSNLVTNSNEYPDL